MRDVTRAQAAVSPKNWPENCVAGGIDAVVTRVVPNSPPLREPDRLTSENPVVSSSP